MFLDLLILVVCITILLVYFPVLISPIAFAPPIPSFRSHREAVTDFLAELKSEAVMEIGSGWGGLMRKILSVPTVKMYYAVELSPVLAGYLWCQKWFYSIPIRVLWLNALSDRISSYLESSDVVVLYTFKEFNQKFSETLKSANRDIYIVSILFPFPEDEQIILCKEKKFQTGSVFLYRFMAKQVV